MSRWTGKKVGVLLGGVSRERDVSLRTGRAIADALRRRQYAVAEIDAGFDLHDRLRAEAVDVAVIALHGPFGEDGSVQGLLEYLRIPYTGAGVVGSAVAIDKVVCKCVATALDIPAPHHELFFATRESIDQCLQRIHFELPVIVKPAREGSTIGMTIVRTADELPQALQLAAGFDTKILIEEFVAGTEVTVSLLAGRALPIIEIVPKHGFYDYTAKYTKGMTEYILPARIAPEMAGMLSEWSLRLWQVLDLRGVARADYIVRRDGTAAFLELNTIPGMTETSLVPKAAAHAGIGFDEVCEQLLNNAGLYGQGAAG